jgi:transglutaminase-like putative cysteine protease
MSGRSRVAVHGGIATLAAASSLSAVYRGFGWLVPVAVAVAIVVGVGELVRRSPIPAALAPLLGAAGVLLLVTRLYAARDALLGVLPTPTSMSALGDVARAGFDDVRKLAPPVPAHHGLVLLAIVGVSAVALVVDLLAVTLRRVALTGLPLLAVFVTGTSVAKHGAAWWSFVVATTGFMWLLLADSRDRLSRWGRSLGFDRDSRPRFSWSDDEVVPSPLSVMGRRVGVTAIAVGVFVPLLVPGLRGGVPHGGGSGFGLGHGHSSVAITVNPIVTMRAQLTSTLAQPLFNVRSNDPSPGYLRLTSLDQFDGDTFSPSKLEQPESAEVSRGIAVSPLRGRTVHTDVAVRALAVHWLPVPSQVTDVQVAGDWRYDAPTSTVFSSRSDTRNLDYSVESVHPDPDPAALEEAASNDPSVSSYLKLPSIPADVRDLTQRVTGTAVSTFDKALAIQRFLTSAPFVYDTTIPAGSGTKALESFLLHDHRGFCQQYASAMAVMARIVHIPARLAVGFTHGDLQADGSWLVTTKDAHAWPELYFNGFGWLPFEPTPRRDGQATPPPYTVVHNPSGNKQPSTGPGANQKGKNGQSPAARSKNQRLDDNADAACVPGAVPPPARPAPSHHTRRIVLLVLLALLGVLLIAPSIVHAAVSRRRWARTAAPADRATAAWAALRAGAIDARVPWVDGLSPRATARLLRIEAAGLAPAELRALDRVVEAVQRAWYAADPSSNRSDGLRDDVEEIRAALFSESTTGERFVLRAWPRSTLRDARVALGRVGELLDVLDLRAARLRARLRPRHA